MGSMGYAATVKDTTVYIKGTWGRDHFVAGGFGSTTSLASVLGKDSTR